MTSEILEAARKINAGEMEPAKRAAACLIAAWASLRAQGVRNAATLAQLAEETAGDAEITRFVDELNAGTEGG